MMQSSLASNTAQLPQVIREEHQGFATNTNNAIIGGCDAAQIGAIQYSIQLAKEMNCPIERIWIDGGNAKILAHEITKLNLPASLVIESIDGLVLRGIWSWLLQNL
jgi:type III pantothenate kinase